MENSIEQINALVLQYGLSETVKQEIINIVNDAYDKGQNDFFDATRMD